MKGLYELTRKERRRETRGQGRKGNGKKTVYTHLFLPIAFRAPHCGQEGFSILLHFLADGLTREDWTLRGDLLLYLQWANQKAPEFSPHISQTSASHVATQHLLQTCITYLSAPALIHSQLLQPSAWGWMLHVMTHTRKQIELLMSWHIMIHVLAITFWS